MAYAGAARTERMSLSGGRTGRRDQYDLKSAVVAVVASSEKARAAKPRVFSCIFLHFPNNNNNNNTPPFPFPTNTSGLF